MYKEREHTIRTINEDTKRCVAILKETPDWRFIRRWQLKREIQRNEDAVAQLDYNHRTRAEARERGRLEAERIDKQRHNKSHFVRTSNNSEVYINGERVIPYGSFKDPYVPKRKQDVRKDERYQRLSKKISGMTEKEAERLIEKQMKLMAEIMKEAGLGEKYGDKE